MNGMWLAVCSNRQCQWARVAPSKVTAELSAQWHQLLRAGQWHPLAIVDIPAAARIEFPPEQDRLGMAA